MGTQGERVSAHPPCALVLLTGVVLGKAGKKMHRKDSKVLYNLSLENAELKNNLLLFMQ